MLMWFLLLRLFWLWFSARSNPSLGYVGRFWGDVEPMLVHVGLFRAYVGPPWVYVQLRLMLGHLGPMLSLSWAYVGPFWGYVGLSWGLLGLRWRYFAFLYIYTRLFPSRISFPIFSSHIVIFLTSPKINLYCLFLIFCFLVVAIT